MILATQELLQFWDGPPFGCGIDFNAYDSYDKLSQALEETFKHFLKYFCACSILYSHSKSQELSHFKAGKRFPEEFRGLLRTGIIEIPSRFMMKVKEVNAGLLSNFEVMVLLQSRGATQDPLGSTGSATQSEFKVFDYLVQSAAGTQTRENVGEYLLKAEKFSLTKAERLQVLNLRPSTAVEAHMIIEDCEERMSSSTVDEFLKMLETTLPPPPLKSEVEGDEENNEADEENDEADEGNDEELEG